MEPFSHSRAPRPAAGGDRGLRRPLGVLLGLLLAVLPTPRAWAASAGQLDYQLKAGYLYNFAKFIEWPPPPMAAGDTFRVGVLVDENAYAIIAETLRGRTIGDHPIEVVLLGLDADVATCRVIFVPKTAPLTPAQFRERLPDAAVLLVGEKDGFAAAGGEIGFVPRGDNLRYQVNLSAAQKVGLKLSAKLASLAEIVRAP